VEGVRYVWSHPVLVHCVTTNFAVGFLALSLVQLAPAVAKDQLHVSDTGYGLVLASAGVGSIATGFFLAAHADRFRRSRTAVWGIAGVGVGGVVVALASGLGLGMAGFLALGIGRSLSAVSLNTSIQLQVAEAFRGRVLAVYLMANVSSPVGTFVLGAVTNAASTRVAAGLGAALTAAYLALSLTAFGALRGLDQHELGEPRRRGARGRHRRDAVGAPAVKESSPS